MVQQGYGKGQVGNETSSFILSFLLKGLLSGIRRICETLLPLFTHYAICRSIVEFGQIAKSSPLLLKQRSSCSFTPSSAEVKHWGLASGQASCALSP